MFCTSSYVHVHWNLSITDIFVSVENILVSTFQSRRSFIHNPMYTAEEPRQCSD